MKAVLKLNVEDWSKFETSFASRKSAREAAGIDALAYRGADDPNVVVVFGTIASKEAFFEFMGSAEQQEAMKNATIQGPPDITFLEG